MNYTTKNDKIAGAYCPGRGADFVLDTENKMFNNTFINANKFHVGTIPNGDNEYLFLHYIILFYFKCFQKKKKTVINL